MSWPWRSPQAPERWVLKGGAALLLRLDPNRTSNDIDLAYVAEAGEHAVALAALVEAAAHDAGDFSGSRSPATRPATSTPTIHSNARSASR